VRKVGLNLVIYHFHCRAQDMYHTGILIQDVSQTKHSSHRMSRATIHRCRPSRADSTLRTNWMTSVFIQQERKQRDTAETKPEVMHSCRRSVAFQSRPATDYEPTLDAHESLSRTTAVANICPTQGSGCYIAQFSISLLALLPSGSKTIFCPI
jgi:hypothetical protein